MKFNLARKYLVSLMAMAIIFASLAMPTLAKPANQPDASAQWTVTLQPSATTVGKNQTVTITVYTYFGGFLYTATSSVYLIYQNNTSTTSTVAATGSGGGTYTATLSWSQTGTYLVEGFIDLDNNGTLSVGEPVSDPLYIVVAAPVFSQLTLQASSTFVDVGLGNPTVTLTVTAKDQFNQNFSATTTLTIKLTITGPNAASKQTTITIPQNSSTGTILFKDGGSPTPWGGTQYYTGTDIFQASDSTGTILSNQVAVSWLHIQTPFQNPPPLVYDSYQYIGQPASFNIYFADKGNYPYPYTVTATGTFAVTGAPTETVTYSGIGGPLTWSYNGPQGGSFEDSVTVIVNASYFDPTIPGNTSTTTQYTQTVTWGYQPSMEVPSTAVYNQTVTVTMWGFPDQTEPTAPSVFSVPYAGPITPTVMSDQWESGYIVYKFTAPIFPCTLYLTGTIYDPVLHENVVFTKAIQVGPSVPPPVTPTQASLVLNLKSGWNMITPGLTISGSPASIFGTGFGAIWYWNPVSASYEAPAALEAGKGYWVYMTADKAVTLSGNQTASPFTKSVGTVGWWQIGNPFETTIPWTNVTISDGTTTKSMADAQAAGWIGYAYSYNTATGSYETANYSTGNVVAGAGYWLQVKVPGLTLTFTK